MPVTGISAEKPFLQRVLRGSTRSLYNGMYNGVFRQSGRYLSKNKAVQIQLGQLILPLIAGLAMMYTQGREAMKPNGDGDKKHWMKVFAEATGGFLAINHAAGVFPLYAMGVGAYRSGQQPDKLSKVQELIKTGIVALMGYAGVQVGAAWSEAADKIDEKELRTVLAKYDQLDKRLAKITPAPLADGATHTPEQLADDALARMRESIRTLRTSLNEVRTSRNPETTAKLYEGIARAKTDLLTQVAAMEKHATGTEKTLATSLEGHLGRHFKGNKLPKILADQIDLIGTAVRNSEEGYIKLARRMNPIFGYIIVGSLAGIPLARLANKWLEKRFPAWKGQKGPQFFTPYPKNPQAPNAQTAGPSVTIPGIGTYS